MVAIAALKPGDVVYAVSSQKMGNTTMRRKVAHGVRIIEVHPDHVIGSWNGNPPRRFPEFSVRQWRRSKPNTE